MNMDIRCIVLRHRNTSYGVWNEGYCFSNCAHCGCDLIRNSGGWRSIPDGFRVVWRAGQHNHAIPSDFKQNLPLAINNRPWWKFGWKLGLHRKGVGCIILPAAPACRTAQPTSGPALADIVIGAVVLALQALFRPPASQSMQNVGRGALS
jgi:hypothetical protein